MNRQQRRAGIAKQRQLGGKAVRLHIRNGCSRCGEQSAEAPIVQSKAGGTYMVCGKCVLKSDLVLALSIGVAS